MLNLTRREKYAIRFLIVFFLIGSGIHLYKMSRNSKNAFSNLEARKDSLQNKVARNDSSYFSNHDESEDKIIQPAGPIPINTATKKQLMQIKGIGPVTAARILQYRNENGRINKLEELTNIKGIGIKTVEKIKNEVTIE